MGDERTYPINDTNRAIQRIIDDLQARKVQDTRDDPRVRAIIITHLEEAQLWSLKLTRASFTEPNGPAEVGRAKFD